MTAPVFFVRGMQYTPPFGFLGTLPSMTVGSAYSAPLTVVGGVPPYTLGSDTLPDGIADSLLSDILTVAGTPTGAGLGAGYAKTFDVVLNVDDNVADTAQFTQTVSITVPTLVNTGTATAGAVGAPYSYSFGSTGGVMGTKTYSYTGTLPGGLTLDTAGLLSGTPTTDSGSPFAFNVFSTDTEGNVSVANAQSMAVSYARWNPADRSASVTLSTANTGATKSVAGNAWASVRADTSRNSGKKYFEIVVSRGLNLDMTLGIATSTLLLDGSTGYAGEGAAGASYGIYIRDGQKATAGVFSAYGSVIPNNAVVGVAVDFTAGKVWFSVNNTWVAGGNPAAGTGEAFSGISGSYFPIASFYNGSSVYLATIRTIATAFTGTVPTGFGPWTTP